MRKIQLIIITSLLLLTTPIINAIGLGEINVDSALNQPLVAQIELVSVSADDVDSLQVKIAPNEVFEQIGVTRTSLINSLRFEPVLIGGKAFINVSSTAAIREPFIDFIIEVSWPNGRLLREYTVLLDPPLFNTTAPVVSQPSAEPTFTQAPAPIQAPVANDEPVFVSAPVEQPVPAVEELPIAQTEPLFTNSAPSNNAFTNEPAPVTTDSQPTFVEPVTSSTIVGDYTVQSGDTLSSIARQTAPAGSTVSQAMMAIYNSNQDAFSQNNINLIKKGYVLRIPDAVEVDALSDSQARAQIREQAALWKQIRNQNTKNVASQTDAIPGEDAKSNTSTADSSTKKSEALTILTPNNEDANSGSATAGSAGESDIALAKEQLVTKNRENEELRSRLEQLETMVEGKNRLLDLKDEELAQMQEKVDELQGQVDTQENAVDEAPEPEVNVAQIDSTNVEPEVEPVVEPEPIVEPEPVIEPEPIVEPEPVIEPEPIVEPEPVIEPEPIVEPEIESGFNFASLLPLLAIPVVLLLGILGFIFFRKRKAAAEVVDEDMLENPTVETLFSEVEPAAKEAEPASALVASDDTEALTDLDNTNTTDNLDLEGDTASSPSSEGDELLTEADVYLAYGLHDQGLDLMKKALADNPERDDYRFKLAEIYKAMGDKAGFLSMSAELHSRVQDKSGAEWTNLIQMGQEIAPEDPMFNGVEVAVNDAAGSEDDSGIGEFDLSNSGLDELENIELDTGLVEAVEEKAEGLEDDGLNLDLGSVGLAAGGLAAAGAAGLVDGLVGDDAEEAPVAADIEAPETLGDLDFNIDELNLGSESTGDAVSDGLDAIAEVENIDVAEGIDDLVGLEDELDLSAMSDENKATFETRDLGSSTTLSFQDTQPVDPVTLGQADEILLDDDKDAINLENILLDTGSEGDSLEDANLDDLASELDALVDESAETGEQILEFNDQTSEFELNLAGIAELEEADATGAFMVDEVKEKVSEPTTEDNPITKDISPYEATEILSETGLTEVIDDIGTGSTQTLSFGIPMSVLESSDINLEEAAEIEVLNTKLELARAYIDMGDDEGAQEALDEVISSGSEEQKAEAKKLLSSLNS